jgi:hypothetical protein
MVAMSCSKATVDDFKALLSGKYWREPVRKYLLNRARRFHGSDVVSLPHYQPEDQSSHSLPRIILSIKRRRNMSDYIPTADADFSDWLKIDGPPPVDPSELRYLATDTRSPYVAGFDGANGGKTAYYMLRWVNTRGETGSWSQTVSATITG